MLTSEHTAAALAAMHDVGLQPDTIEADGKIHRCGTVEKPKSKNGWYVAYADGVVCVCYGNWASGESGSWAAKGEGKLTAAEKAELSRRMEEARKAREADQARIHAEAAARAKAIYDTAQDCTGHPYLERKGVRIGWNYERRHIP
jgi:putative DNA primase/helicase